MTATQQDNVNINLDKGILKREHELCNTSDFNHKRQQNPINDPRTMYTPPTEVQRQQS